MDGGVTEDAMEGEVLETGEGEAKEVAMLISIMYEMAMRSYCRLPHGDGPEDEVVALGETERVVELSHGSDEGIGWWMSWLNHVD